MPHAHAPFHFSQPRNACTSTSPASVCAKQPDRNSSMCLHMRGLTPGCPCNRHSIQETRIASGRAPATVACTKSTSSFAETDTTSFPNNSSALFVHGVVCLREKKYTSKPSMPSVDICACSSTWSGIGVFCDDQDRLLGMKYLHDGCYDAMHCHATP
eukprot:2015490-Amphidinium_carterae.2